MTVVARFAPSPTGYLHIGGARTALFNWLFARHHGGKFLLRIEDTDRARSTEPAIEAIKDGLAWLGLDWDGDAISQFARRERHAEVARELLAKGRAYYCYCTPEELTVMREAAKKAGSARLYNGYWRDRDPAEAPKGVAPVIRLKAPLDGETTVDDKVQGPVRVANDQLDDMVLLRGDGTPTYMLAVVVDDHDMGVTHVIRGDDHLTNTFRQYQIYKAMDWTVPSFSHIPLIHGPDGAKMSKRHGALGVDAYRDMGYLPEAMRNYLLRLSWAHGNDEIISTEQAIQWFDLDGIGRSAARFDFAKLENLNAHYIRQADDKRLALLAMPVLVKQLQGNLAADAVDRLKRGMPGLKERAKTIVDLADKAAFYVRTRPLPTDDKARKLLDAQGLDLIRQLKAELDGAGTWTKTSLEGIAREFSERNAVGLGKIAQPLRAALTGSTVSPGIFDVMEVLGKEETFGRLDDAVSGRMQA
jgi:glutamyl-tRNA synthetase